MKTGRKSAYEERIEPRLDEIKKWIERGYTEKSIAKQLGVAYSTFNKYKVEIPEFAEILKKSRGKAVDELENAMFKRAMGFQYVEETITETEDEKKVVKVKKTALPDVTAGIYLLKHWGKDRGYTNDPVTTDLKKKELKIKEKIAEESNW